MEKRQARLNALVNDLALATNCDVCCLDACGRRAAASCAVCAGACRALCDAGALAVCAALRAGGAAAGYLASPIVCGDWQAGTLVMGPLGHNDERRAQALFTVLGALAERIGRENLLSRPADLFVELSRYVDAHLSDELTARTLCPVLFVSGSTLSRVVRRESGLPLRLYIQTRRLEAARVLLLSTTLPVMQVAYQCGISDFNYFSRIFKRRFGVSPRGLRAQGVTPAPANSCTRL